jgi:hypothetical protein
VTHEILEALGGRGRLVQSDDDHPYVEVEIVTDSSYLDKLVPVARRWAMSTIGTPKHVVDTVDDEEWLDLLVTSHTDTSLVSVSDAPGNEDSTQTSRTWLYRGPGRGRIFLNPGVLMELLVSVVPSCEVRTYASIKGKRYVEVARMSGGVIEPLDYFLVDDDD